MFVNRVILSVKILEWEELIRRSKLLTLLFLAKLNLNLYTDSNIWLRSARDLKVYCFLIMQQQQIDVNEIQISKTYQQAMKSSQRDEWIMTMKIEIHNIKRKKIYSLVEWSTDKKIKILDDKWIFLIKINKNNKILRYKISWVRTCRIIGETETETEIEMAKLKIRSFGRGKSLLTRSENKRHVQLRYCLSWLFWIDKEFQRLFYGEMESGELN